MFLVAGLAVAGLVGIAAAFYFSIRSGNGGDKRLRSAGAGRAGAGRRPGSRAATARPDLTRPGLNGHPRRTAGGTGPVTTFKPAASPRAYRAKADTGPDPVADFDVLADSGRTTPDAAATRGGGRRSGARTAEPVAARRLGDTHALPEGPWPDPMPGDPTATDPQLGAAGRGAAETQSAARLSRDAHAAGGAARTAKPRRRVAFRKGADLDEELWPAETFGGVSDEQFWDDLASDKPLATTARTAQQDPPARNRLSGPAPGTGLTNGPAAGLNTGPATDPQAIQAQADDRKRDDRKRDDRKRDDRGPGGGRRGTYPAPRTAPDPAAERTAIQPAYAATQPVQSMKPPVPGATPPVRAAVNSQPMSAISQPMSATSRPGAASQPREAATPPRGTAAQPRGGGTQPAETRRRRPSSAEEDPLTSAAFSLRPSGPVDGRSSLRARNGSADRHDSGGSPESHGGTSPYPYSTSSYGDPSSLTQTMSTPPYGQDYGYGTGNSAAPASEPRRHNGGGSHARPEGTGDGTRPVRLATGSHRGNGGNQGSGGYSVNGSYPANGSYPGNGYPGSGYQGNGHRGNGHRAPYDPRDDYRRSTHQH